MHGEQLRGFGGGEEQRKNKEKGHGGFEDNPFYPAGTFSYDYHKASERQRAKEWCVATAASPAVRSWLMDA